MYKIKEDTSFNLKKKTFYLPKLDYIFKNILFTITSANRRCISGLKIININK